MAPCSTQDCPAAAGHGALLAVCLAALALPLAFSAGAVVVPSLHPGPDDSPLALAWVTNAFMLTFSGLLLAAGALADRLGRRRVFLAGTAGFAAATACVCMAPGLPWLDIARGLQGVAAAAALAAGTAALADAWQGPGRARAFAVLGTTFGAGLALGPLLAGVLLQWVGWRGVFASGGVLALLACVLGVRLLRESHGDRARLDVAGMLVFSLMLASLTLALLWLGEQGIGAPRVWGAFGACAVLAILLVRLQQRQASPLLDLSLFSQRAFVGVQLLPVATCFGYVVLLAVLPLQLLGVHGQGTAMVGLQMLALSAPLLVLPMLAARCAQHVGSALLCTLGLLLCAQGLWWLSQHAAAPVPQQWIAPLLLIGAGAALPWGLMDGLSVSVVPVQRAGMAAGLFGTVRVAGEGIALAAVTALLAALIGRHLPAAWPEATASASLYLASGDLEGAQAWLPHATVAELQQASGQALAQLLRTLSMLTLGCALLLQLLLGRRGLALAEAADSA